MCLKQWALTKIPNRTAKTNRIWTVRHYLFFNSSGIPLWVNWLVLCVQHFHFIDVWKIVNKNLSTQKTQANQATHGALEAAVVSGLLLQFASCFHCQFHVGASARFLFLLFPCYIAAFLRNGLEYQKNYEPQIRAVVVQSCLMWQNSCRLHPFMSTCLSFVWCETIL